jgi:hypothetical protein
MSHSAAASAPGSHSSAQGHPHPLTLMLLPGSLHSREAGSVVACPCPCVPPSARGAQEHPLQWGGQLQVWRQVNRQQAGQLDEAKWLCAQGNHRNTNSCLAVISGHASAGSLSISHADQLLEVVSCISQVPPAPAPTSAPVPGSAVSSLCTRSLAPGLREGQGGDSKSSWPDKTAAKMSWNKARARTPLHMSVLSIHRASSHVVSVRKHLHCFLLRSPCYSCLPCSASSCCTEGPHQDCVVPSATQGAHE